MENLEILSTHVTVQAKKIINGDTVNLSWNYNMGETPKAVNFNSKRGTETDNPMFTGNNIISGAYYSDNGKFDVTNNNFQEGDFDLYAEILNVCKSIVGNVENLAKNHASEN